MTRWTACSAAVLLGLFSTAQAQIPAFIVRVAPGGADPTQACTPVYSVQNWTGQDLGAFHIELEWRHATSGETLRDGAGVQKLAPFATGDRRDLTGTGWSVPCRDLTLAIGGYACEAADGTRTPCPGLIRIEAEGGMDVDRRAAREGAVR